MATRAMVFIDGTWLSVTANRLADQHGLQGRTGGPLDFGALPRVCAQAIAAQMASTTGLDVVRTHYFGSIATNFDVVDQDAVQRRSEFFDSLRRHHRYEVYRFETDYRGHRVRRTPGEDGFVPQEKAVDVGLATALLEMAAVSAYDIAIVVCGDRDFVPALQAVRRLGKRVAIVSARGSCSRELSDPNDPMRVRDFDPLWLDLLWSQVVAPGARTLRVNGDVATGPGPEGSADFPSEGEVPGFGDEVYPVAARGASVALADSPYMDERDVSALSGVVTKVHANGYGFVRGDDGADYYFRRSDFADVTDFSRLERFRTRLTFRVSEQARPGQAGRAATLVVSGVHDPSVPVSPRPAFSPAPSPVLTDDLWALDPFAAPVRREAAPVASADAAEVTIVDGGVSGDAAASPVEREVALAVPVAADVAPVVAAEGMAEIGADAVAAPVAPRKKRVSRKSLPA
ncbi:MAG: NYN domain-containing protein [Gemmatimonas sp.]|uniref:NYN domain-containing protein n=1 Tax=Gemmatimonas sp. TaxID=1962908 RepID=UPI0022C8561D|nr:NYN domain-containing protein [Gemmatimonas sp.]MCZ8010451.1 NYN domain-containing protein [Gemmatimonas sp.]MCZ8267014.1 NYN domain-containing protein [Gemmatimonas sp.]